MVALPPDIAAAYRACTAQRPMVALPADVAAVYRARARDAREQAQAAAVLAAMSTIGRGKRSRLARPIPTGLVQLLSPRRRCGWLNTTAETERLVIATG
jgi:hypothetical protein